MCMTSPRLPDSSKLMFNLRRSISYLRYCSLLRFTALCTLHHPTTISNHSNIEQTGPTISTCRIVRHVTLVETEIEH